MIPAITEKGVVVAVDVPFSHFAVRVRGDQRRGCLQHLDRNTAKEIGVKEKCKVAFV